jgi:hypothetical protein
MDEEHNKKVVKVLEFILDKLSKTDIDWVLTGSTNLLIQGLFVQAKDIDIVSTKEDLFRIEKMFAKYIKKKVQYSESKKYRSWFGRLVIKGIQVDLMAELEYKPPESDWVKSFTMENRIAITFNNTQINVNPVENELTFYKKMNRKNDDKKRELIIEFKNKTRKAKQNKFK